MKSLSNTTEYDDKLFFQIISDSFKKLFICPCDKPFQIKKTKKTNIIIEKPGKHKVKASATGKIIYSADNILILEHENNIYTTYKNIIPLTITNGKITQGTPIAEFQNTFSFSISIKPLDITEENNV